MYTKYILCKVVYFCYMLVKIKVLLWLYELALRKSLFVINFQPLLRMNGVVR